MLLLLELSLILAPFVLFLLFLGDPLPQSPVTQPRLYPTFTQRMGSGPAKKGKRTILLSGFHILCAGSSSTGKDDVHLPAAALADLWICLELISSWVLVNT